MSSTIPIQRDHPLPTSLSAAVPIWAMRLCDTSIEHVFDKEQLTKLADRLREAGEALIHRIPGRTADGFNALAEIIARLAFCKGGVKCFGMHFEYEIGKWKEGKHGVSIPDPSGATIVSNQSVEHGLGEIGILVRKRIGFGRIPKRGK